MEKIRIKDRKLLAEILAAKKANAALPPKPEVKWWPTDNSKHNARYLIYLANMGTPVGEHNVRMAQDYLAALRLIEQLKDEVTHARHSHHSQ